MKRIVFSFIVIIGSINSLKGIVTNEMCRRGYEYDENTEKCKRFPYRACKNILSFVESDICLKEQRDRSESKRLGEPDSYNPRAQHQLTTPIDIHRINALR